MLEKRNKEVSLINTQLTNEKDRLAREKMEAVNEKNLTKSGVSALTREIEYLRKQVDAEKQNIVNLKHDRDKMSVSIKRAEDENVATKDELIKQINEYKKLMDDLERNKATLQGNLKKMAALEKERDKFSHEASKANANLMQMVEEVKLKKNLISELKKENIEFEGKLKQQQNLYEAVRSDRNLYSKNLIEAQDEVAELKRKFKIASHQIAQLKDEIEAKDQALTNEHHDLSIAKKEIETVKTTLELEKSNHKKAKELIERHQNQVNKLTFIIKEAHEEHEKLKKDYQNVINERDILGTQLIRRNDELALLYEKIKILQSTLAKGEVQYQERLEDIRLLKFKIADLKSELRIVKSQAAQIGDLRKEVYNLQQQLLTERLQVKALSEELENPLNYHRWRKLEGTDPDTWEMLQKIQTLQKRLIKKTEEVVEKDVVIQEKEKLYIELKNLLARQPGPEVAEQLSIYQQNLKEKTRQMKAMAAELNMYQAQVNEYKYEIERLTRELQDMKRKYYEQKRREQIQREAQQRLDPKNSIKQQTAPV
jgi:chromosome segregation ATPase